jgi:hypothetical protein
LKGCSGGRLISSGIKEETAGMTEPNPTYTIHNSTLQTKRDLAILLERIIQDYERNAGLEIESIKLNRTFEIVWGEFVNTTTHPLESVEIEIHE